MARSVPSSAATVQLNTLRRALVCAAALGLLCSGPGCMRPGYQLFHAKKAEPGARTRCADLCEEVWFRSADGLLLNGWLLEGAPGGPHLLYIHGNGSNLEDNVDYLRLLHGQGFSVFIFDFRGYGRSEGEPLQEQDLYQDARSAITFLEGRGWHHGELIYYGQSLGAAVALQLALESPPAGLVLESAFTSMADLVQDASPLPRALAFWLSDELRFDNLSKIATLRAPLLLLHGDRDTVVPLAMARRLFARARPPKLFGVIRGGGHCDASLLDQRAYLASWDQFLGALPSWTPLARAPEPALHAPTGGLRSGAR